MGLLDALFPSSDGGGLLDFLKNNANASIANNPGAMASDTAQYGAPQMPAPYQPGQVQAAPLAAPGAAPSGWNSPWPQDNMQWPQGPIGAPGQPAAPAQSSALALAPQGAQPSPQLGLPPQQDASPLSGVQNFFNRTADALGSISRGGSMLGAVRGQFDDPRSQAAAQSNMTARALVAKGVDPQVAIAAVQPGNTEFLKTLIDQKFGAPKAPTALGEGHIWNPATGKVEQAYEPEDKNKIVQIGEDGLGQKQFGIFNPSDGSIKPIPAPGGSGAAGSAGGLGDMSKTGAEYLATVPPQVRGVLQGMVDGTIQPPSSFAASKPYWQNMLAAAKQVDPNFDANTWASRHKMSTDIAASGNSSIGGILANGKSSFSHLADLSESMAGLGNASHDYPGGGAAAAVQNYVGNKVLAGSDTRAKIKAINDNLGHYGQESTKFYSGTGGGAEERMNALKEMNPETTSSAEMASYVEKEKALMLERLREKERNIRDTMGPEYLQRHPVMTPEFQATIDKIDQNIAKLRGQQPSAGSTPSVTEGATATNPQTGERLVRRNGQWVPVQ